ncbi:uncharacterized protein [Oscarella lobularis]|uniref:uncharacterized protein n=1 Tax=Oscarella lobularis TaxID=121494 RepID=UPI0033130F58
MRVVTALLLTISYLYANADNNCILTEGLPQPTNGLNFCRKYTKNACCYPPHDLELEQALRTLLDTGDSCRIADIRDHPMSILYCLPCSPEQPKFVRDGKVYLCQSWVDRAFGSGKTLYKAHNLNTCGVLVSSPCVNVNETEIPNRDRYVCGDDYVFPNEGMSVETFLNSERSIGPLGLSVEDNYTFVVVNSTVNCFNSAETVQLNFLFVIAVAAATLIFLAEFTNAENLLTVFD